MERPQKPDNWIALFVNLADAEASLHALQDVGVPYPAMEMGTHTSDELAQLTAEERERMAGIDAPPQFWSLAITLEPQWRDKAIEVLRQHNPMAFGSLPSMDNRRDDTERGAIAWRHYVFETSAATDAVGEYAGTTGNTGIISSGVFAEGALAEGNPPAPAIDASDQRQVQADQSPTSNTLKPEVSNEGSRPDNKLTEQ